MFDISRFINFVQESRSEDETLETLCENVTELIRLLEEEGSKPLEPKGSLIVLIIQQAV